MSCGDELSPAVLPDAVLRRLLALDFLSPAASCGTSSCPVASPQSVLGSRGLVNVANRCFLLSSLQCLLAAPPVRRFLTQCVRGLHADRDAVSIQQLANTAPVHAELLLFVLSYRGTDSSREDGSEQREAEPARTLAPAAEALPPPPPAAAADTASATAASTSGAARRRRRRRHGQTGSGSAPPPPSSASRPLPPPAASSLPLGCAAPLTPFTPSFPVLLSSFQQQQAGRQEDAAELLLCLLNGLQEEETRLQRLNRRQEDDEQRATVDGDWTEVGRGSRELIVRPSVSLPVTPVSRLFAFRLRSTLRLPSRHRDSVSWQPAFMLPLDLQPGDSVQAALARCFSPSAVQSQRSSGGRQQQATQSLALDAASLPACLLLHIKRFAAAERGPVLKLSQHIAFEAELRLPAACLHPAATASSPPPSYRLSAVLVHHGDSAHRGHYTACVNQPSAPEHWLQLDDDRVRPLSLCEVQQQQAYCLLYSQHAAS